MLQDQQWFVSRDRFPLAEEGHPLDLPHQSQNFALHELGAGFHFLG
jgi:hypothetical protein